MKQHTLTYTEFKLIDFFVFRHNFIRILFWLLLASFLNEVLSQSVILGILICLSKPNSFQQLLMISIKFTFSIYFRNSTIQCCCCCFPLSFFFLIHSIESIFLAILTNASQYLYKTFVKLIFVCFHSSLAIYYFEASFCFHLIDIISPS